MTPLRALMKDLSVYDLYALTVAVMLLGHGAYFFLPEETWPRVPDRILIPVFMIPIGYNAGKKPGLSIWIGAGILFLSELILMNSFYINTLGTIILVRHTIEPIMTWLVKNTERFWIAMLAFAILGPITNLGFEYGTTALVYATMGWLLKNRMIAETSKIDLRAVCIFTFLTHVITIKLLFPFSEIQMLVFTLGSAIIFYLMYNFKNLLLNAVRRKPKDSIEKFCHFLGHKSLEIYVLHLLVLQVVFFVFVKSHF